MIPRMTTIPINCNSLHIIRANRPINRLLFLIEREDFRVLHAAVHAILHKGLTVFKNIALLLFLLGRNGKIVALRRIESATLGLHLSICILMSSILLSGKVVLSLINSWHLILIFNLNVELYIYWFILQRFIAQPLIHIHRHRITHRLRRQ